MLRAQGTVLNIKQILFEKKWVDQQNVSLMVIRSKERAGLCRQQTFSHGDWTNPVTVNILLITVPLERGENEDVFTSELLAH